MKRKKNIVAITFLVVMVGCEGGGKQASDDLITVDVTKNYPKKELILQDFMDVEYIPLETTDDFLTQGLVKDIGKEIILVTNRFNDGDIFVYNRNGKGIRKINRKGQGGEEYTYIFTITLDEDNEELFVSDIFAKCFFVYDLYGSFKRSFKHEANACTSYYTDVFNYDRDNLICYDRENEERGFVLISKQDGKITKEIKIPFIELKEAKVRRMIDEETSVSNSITSYHIIPYNNKWILTEHSSDTIFSCSHNYNMTPFIIRTPSVQSLNPEVFLVLGIITKQYYFMKAVKKIYNFETEEGFPSTEFMFDKQENAIFGFTVYNSDYSNNKQINMISRPVNNEIATWQIIQAYQLLEAYNKGELKEGKLKEIAAELDEEDNPVIMIVKHKK